MAYLSDFAGAGSLVEGQRLLAKRRGPLKTWFHRHPLAVNLILALIAFLFIVGHYLIVLGDALSEIDGTLVVPEGVSYFWPTFLLSIPLNLGYLALIFLRERWSLQLLLLGAFCELVITLTPAYPVMLSSGFAGIVFLYTMASRWDLKGSLWGLLAFQLLASIAIVWVQYYPDPIDLWFSASEPETSGDPEVASWGFTVTILLLYLFFSILIYMMGRAVYRSRTFDRAVLAGFEQNQLLAATQERNRIAREMHDVVAHSLTVMISLADAARIVGKKDPEKAGEVLAELSTTGRTALADMRRTLGVLRDSDAARAPLTPAGGEGDARQNLSELVDSFSATGLPVSFSYEGEELPSDPNLRLSLYRMVQESLTNVLRYGNVVREVQVRLLVTRPDIYLVVINDGLGIDAQQVSLGSGRGLVGMKERAAFYGGSVEAGPN